MTLKNKGLRFFISPDASKARWMLAVEKEAFYSDYLDATDWPDDVFLTFLMKWLG